MVDLDLIFDGLRQHFRSSAMTAAGGRKSYSFSGLED